jgi:hypothetical protein
MRSAASAALTGVWCAWRSWPRRGDAHRDITTGQPRAVVSPRHRSARGPQLGLFASTQAERMRDAILGERDR